MEQHSQFDKPIGEEGLVVLEAQVRECYGRVVYSHKVHEKDADIYFKRMKRLKLWQIILSTVTTGGLLALLLGQGRLATIVAALASSILLALTIYTKDYDLGEIAQKHTNTASRLWMIREAYLSLLSDIAAGDTSIHQVRKRRDELQEDLSAIYTNAPRTTRRAYTLTQKALKIGQELTFTNKEIDTFLPDSLRKQQL